MVSIALSVLFISVLPLCSDLSGYKFSCNISCYLFSIKLKIPSGEGINPKCYSGEACFEVICFGVGLF